MPVWWWSRRSDYQICKELDLFNCFDLSGIFRRCAWCSGQCIRRVQFLAWYMDNLIVKTVHPKSKWKSQWEGVQMLGSQNGYQWLVIRFYGNLLSQYVLCISYLALLNYRATPLHWCGWSPKELLMGRKVRTTLPQTASQSIPDWKFLKEFRRMTSTKSNKRRTTTNDRVRSQSPLSVNNSVVVKTGDQTVPCSVVSPAQTPRSYLIDMPSGQVRRNRSHLLPIKGNSSSESDSPTPSILPRSYPRSPIMTLTRTRTEICPPDKLSL